MKYKLQQAVCLLSFTLCVANTGILVLNDAFVPAIGFVLAAIFAAIAYLGWARNAQLECLVSDEIADDAWNQAKVLADEAIAE